jgi:hypothetical protein
MGHLTTVDVIAGLHATGRSGHAVKCGRIRLAVSCSPQPQPHFIRGPGEMRANSPSRNNHGSRATSPAVHQ